MNSKRFCARCKKKTEHAWAGYVLGENYFYCIECNMLRGVRSIHDPDCSTYLGKDKLKKLSEVDHD